MTRLGQWLKRETILSYYYISHLCFPPTILAMVGEKFIAILFEKNNRRKYVGGDNRCNSNSTEL